MEDVEVIMPPIDEVESVLDVAAEILDECAPDPGNTRLERMARWIVRSIDPVIYQVESGAVVWLEHPAGVRVIQCGEKIAVEFPKFVDHEQARCAASLLLRAAERAERQG